MINLLVFAYGLLAMFVLNCATRNARANRAHSPTLTLVGLGLMSASFAAAGLTFATALAVTVI